MLMALCFEPSRFFLKGKSETEKEKSYVHKLIPMKYKQSSIMIFHQGVLRISCV